MTHYTNDIEEIDDLLGEGQLGEYRKSLISASTRAWTLQQNLGCVR